MLSLSVYLWSKYWKWMKSQTLGKGVQGKQEEDPTGTLKSIWHLTLVLIFDWPTLLSAHRLNCCTNCEKNNLKFYYIEKNKEIFFEKYDIMNQLCWCWQFSSLHTKPLVPIFSHLAVYLTYCCKDASIRSYGHLSNQHVPLKSISDFVPFSRRRNPLIII